MTNDERRKSAVLAFVIRRLSFVRSMLFSRIISYSTAYFGQPCTRACDTAPTDTSENAAKIQITGA